MYELSENSSPLSGSSTRKPFILVCREEWKNSASAEVWFPYVLMRSAYILVIVGWVGIWGLNAEFCLTIQFIKRWSCTQNGLGINLSICVPNQEKNICHNMLTKSWIRSLDSIYLYVIFLRACHSSVLAFPWSRCYYVTFRSVSNRYK